MRLLSYNVARVEKEILALPSDRKAHRENPAVIVLMEPGCGDLHTAADSKTQVLRDLKHAKDNPGGRNVCFLARVWSMFLAQHQYHRS